jgi:pimeloyl-ACP methyl ester carboxylesterase
MSEGFAEVGDGRLWYERAGDGFPVVFAHSGLVDARAWEPQFEAPNRCRARASASSPRRTSW